MVWLFGGQVEHCNLFSILFRGIRQHSYLVRDFWLLVF